MPVIWVGLRKFDCRCGRGKEKGVGLTANQWKQIFLDCNNHILVEVTVLGIFTKMRMRLKVVSWDMTLRHIWEGFSPELWHCIISQLSWVMRLHHIPEASVLGYATLYPSRILPWAMMLHHIPEEFCPGLWWWCIISQLPCVTMLQHIPKEHNPQPHSCDNLRTKNNKESKCCLNILLLTAVNQLDCFISVQSTGAVWTAA